MCVCLAVRVCLQMGVCEPAQGCVGVCTNVCNCVKVYVV